MRIIGSAAAALVLAASTGCRQGAQDRAATRTPAAGPAAPAAAAKAEARVVAANGAPMSAPADTEAEPKVLAAPNERHLPPPDRLRPQESLGHALPDDLPGLGGGDVEQGAGFAQRVYAKGSQRVKVTVSRYGGSDLQYAEWRRGGAKRPAASLGLPEDVATGFFDCVGPDDARLCSLSVQLRAGYHVDISADAPLGKGELERLARALPLEDLGDEIL